MTIIQNVGRRNPATSQGTGLFSSVQTQRLKRQHQCYSEHTQIDVLIRVIAMKDAVESSSGLHLVTLRSDEERHTEKAHSTYLGPEADALVAELLHIGQRTGYTSDPGGDFNAHGHHKRTREIGTTLNNMGGIQLMQAAYYRILAVLGLRASRSLELAWAYIGGWQP